MFLNNYINTISEDKYRYYKCNFDEKNNYVHTFEEKTFCYVVKKIKLKGNLIFIESLIFLFFSFLIFQKFYTLNVRFHLPAKKKKNYRTLHYPIQGR